MEAEKYQAAWDDFLEAYKLIKDQKEALIQMISTTAEAMDEEGMGEVANTLRQELGKILNGQSIGNSKSGNEDQPQDEEEVGI